MSLLLKLIIINLPLWKKEFYSRRHACPLRSLPFHVSTGEGVGFIYLFLNVNVQPERMSKCIGRYWWAAVCFHTIRCHYILHTGRTLLNVSCTECCEWFGDNVLQTLSSVTIFKVRIQSGETIVFCPCVGRSTKVKTHLPQRANLRICSHCASLSCEQDGACCHRTRRDHQMATFEWRQL